MLQYDKILHKTAWLNYPDKICRAKTSHSGIYTVHCLSSGTKEGKLKQKSGDKNILHKGFFANVIKGTPQRSLQTDFISSFKKNRVFLNSG